jgi:hypothetical protein
MSKKSNPSALATANPRVVRAMNSPMPDHISTRVLSDHFSLHGLIRDQPVSYSRFSDDEARVGGVVANLLAYMADSDAQIM